MHGKAFWQGIIDAEFAVPDGHTAAELANELFDYIGSTDPALRDTLGYSIFVRWVLADRFAVDDLRALLPRLQTQLTVGIGEQGTDSVFGRAFAVLWLAAIAYYDTHHQQFLTEEQTRDLMDSALTYFAAEKDLRGHVPVKGWAHSCAHTADLIDELVQHRHLDGNDVARCLNAIASKVQAETGHIFQCEEDERMAYAVVTALQNERVTAGIVAAWLKHFSDWAAAHARYSYADDAALWGVYVNTKNLLRSVFVRLSIAEDVTDTARVHLPAVQAALKLYTLRM